MLMKWCTNFVLLLAYMLVLGLVVPASPAQAASVYDNIIQVTDDVTVYEQYYNHSQEITPNFESLSSIASCSSPLGVFELDSTSTDFVWSMYQYTDGMEQKAIIRWSVAPGAGYQFKDFGGADQWLVTKAGYQIKSIAINMSYSGNLYCSSINYLSSEDFMAREGIPIKFWANTFPVAYPAGYAGVYLPYERPVTYYAALGDSFSSGEGNSPFDTTTDLADVNECHRSSIAYPRQLREALNLGNMAFDACSGATTSDLLNGKWNEASQVDALTNNIDIVTLTIGGNDVGFGDYAQQCVVTLCGPTTNPYTMIMSNISDPAFKDNLVDTYGAILNAAPNANVYVASYPYLAPENAQCGGVVDLSGTYYVQQALNSVIEDAVDEAGGIGSRLHFVDANADGSPFVERYICGGDKASDFYSFEPEAVYKSFHPNVSGQNHFAQLFEEYMS